MKKIIIPVIVLIIVLIGWKLFNKKSEKKDTLPLTSKIENPTFSQGSQTTERKRLYFENRNKADKELFKKLNKPFQFFGKVVDQNGVPLSGVKIQYRVTQPKQSWKSNTYLKTINSMPDGTFAIHDTGSGFSFQSFKKDGYRKSKGQQIGFSYSASSEQHKRDDSQIRVYTLIKNDEIQGLIPTSRQLLLDWDGVPIHYDVKIGKFGKSGEIKITALRGKIEGEGRQARYDWSFKLEVPNGGIIETTREEAYFAPEEGYKPFWEYSFLSSDPKWGHRKRGQTFLFFKLQNGNYGRLELDFSAELGSRISGRINTYLNPLGGRMLEYDATRKIIKKR